MAGYMRTHVTDNLISRGRARYSADGAWLASIQARYGVDPAVLMAIFGHETSYGTVTGNSDLLQTLASLAYGGRRRALFEPEFIAALKLIDQGVPRSMLKGSWAGATGYPQFLPTVALRLRADGDGVSSIGSHLLMLPRTKAPYQVAFKWDLGGMGAGTSAVSSFGEGDFTLPAGPLNRLSEAFYMAGTIRRVPADPKSAFSAVRTGDPGPSHDRYLFKSALNS